MLNCAEYCIIDSEGTRQTKRKEGGREMFEILTNVRLRNDLNSFQKRYLFSQVTPDYGKKGIKPVLYKILDTIGL